MNRIVMLAQLMGALLLIVACSAIADPAQGQVKRVLKAGSGDEPGTLKGHIKWGDIVLKARVIAPEGPRTLRESQAPVAPTPIKLLASLDWETRLDRSTFETVNRVLRGDRRTRPAEVMLGARKIMLQNALLTEIGFPALDGAAKEPAYLTVKMAGEVLPSTSETTATRLSRTPPPSGASAEKQKTWLPSNFRLKIDGLDCSKVFKVSPLLMRPAATPGSNRIWGDPHVTEITMPEADFRRANMAKWELSEFDASKVPIRPRSGKLSLFEQGGSPLIAASFRMFQIRRIRPLGGGKVMFEAVLDRFELSKS